MIGMFSLLTPPSIWVTEEKRSPSMIEVVLSSLLKPLMLDFTVTKDESVPGLCPDFFRQIQNWKDILRSWYVRVEVGYDAIATDGVCFVIVKQRYMLL